MTLQPQPPRKVVRKAQELGVHTDCLVSGVEGCCSDCFQIIMVSFDFFYGHLNTPAEKIAGIMDDLFADREEDV